MHVPYPRSGSGGLTKVNIVRRPWTALLVAVLALAGLPALARPAQALTPPLAFVSAQSPTYQTNGIAWAVAQSQGRVYVGGAFTSVRPAGAAKGTGEVARTNLVALSATSGAPSGCTLPAVTGTSTSTNKVTVRSLAVSPDGGTLYVGGYFSKVGSSARSNLAAIRLSDCTVTGFAPNPNGIVRTIAATSSTVYYGGSFTAVGGSSRGKAAASSTSGALLGWSPKMDQDVRAIAVRQDGSSVVVGGDFDTVGTASIHALVVLHPTTAAVVKSFGSLIPSLSDVHDLAIDGKGFYTGNEGHGTGVFDGRLAIAWDTWATRWKDDCLGATQSLAVYRGVLYSGSHAHDCGAEGEFPDGIRHHLLAQSVDSPNKLPWFPQTNDGLGEALGPRDMVVAPNGSSGDALWVVGEFTTVNGTSQTGITRFVQGTDTAGPSTATSTVSSPRSGEARVAFRAAFDTDDWALTYRVYRDGSTTAAYTTTVTAPFWNRRQITFTDTGLSPGSSHSYRVDVTDGTKTAKGAVKSVTIASRASAYADRVKADGASFLWRYDEASDVLVSDALPTSATGTVGTNGTLRGSATVGAGAIVGESSKARTLGGSTTTIYTETPTAWTSGKDLTVETWIKTTTTSGGKIIGMGDKQDAQSKVSDKQVYMTNAGTLSFGVQSGGPKRVTSAKAYNDGAWHHVAATLGAGGMTLYVDGAKVAGNTAVTSSAAFARGYWRVGGDTLNASTWSNASTSPFWRGTVDETAVYPTALSATAVKAHFDIGR